MSVCLPSRLWYSLPAAVLFWMLGSLGWTLMRGRRLTSWMRSSTSASSSTSGRTTARTLSSENSAISSSARAWVIRLPPSRYCA
ncbi:MAG: hypothetical protein IKQ60_06380 [Candidatus Methanomethylophilaceae archaeon]|nr:hypothetical protein [Candidatus Methanomethylophilaceae archaeon]